ncbi:MAG: hypothetical protein L0338_14215 [Acidobacteria bacterium]|nr:hypothetical protein [Acidobacteriota bacterium]
MASRRRTGHSPQPALHSTYLQSLRRWNFIYAAATDSADFDLMNSVWTLQRIPMNLVSWNTPSSFRWDVQSRQDSDRFQRPQAVLPLPPGERVIMKWNGSPYQLDGGSNGTTKTTAPSSCCRTGWECNHNRVGDRSKTAAGTAAPTLKPHSILLTGYSSPPR